MANLEIGLQGNHRSDGGIIAKVVSFGVHALVDVLEGRRAGLARE